LALDPSRFEEILEKRFKYASELKALLEALSVSASSSSVEEEILSLYRKYAGQRKILEKMFSKVEKEVEDPSARELYETLRDFYELVDLDAEAEILEELLERARKSQGALGKSVDELEREAQLLKSALAKLGKGFMPTR